MKLKTNISVILFAALILLYSCEEEKRPVREKKRFTTEEKSEKNKQDETISSQENSNLFKITKDQFENYGMELGFAGKSTIDESITAAGYIEVPKESMAEVRSYIGGYLKSSPLLPGNFVKKGQFLISLENLEYIQLQQEYLEIKEELQFLKSVYDRKKVLQEENITSLSSKQEAESDYFSVLANYEGLRKKLQLINIDPDKIQAGNISSSINIYSPIEGYITMANAVKGKFVEPTDVIFEIINTNHLHIELKVYEKDILKVREGQKISFIIPESNSESYSGNVFLVGKTIDPTDRTVAVHCHIDEGQNLPVVVGMYIESKIFIESRESLCLPVGAFVKEEELYFVFVKNSVSDEEYIFEKTKISVGQVNEDCIEIVDPGQKLLEGKQVLIEGAFDL